MTPEAKFSWLMAAVALVLFTLIVLWLTRLESGAFLVTHLRST
jgi:hypothetical protein